jgi:hypothetical protein
MSTQRLQTGHLTKWSRSSCGSPPSRLPMILRGMAPKRHATDNVPHSKQLRGTLNFFPFFATYARGKKEWGPT